jgi:hypothetical protein
MVDLAAAAVVVVVAKQTPQHLDRLVVQELWGKDLPAVEDETGPAAFIGDLGVAAVQLVLAKMLSTAAAAPGVEVAKAVTVYCQQSMDNRYDMVPAVAATHPMINNRLVAEPAADVAVLG